MAKLRKLKLENGEEILVREEDIIEKAEHDMTFADVKAIIAENRRRTPRDENGNYLNSWG